MFDKLRRPIVFQGAKQKAPYFEGWYFKHVSADEKTAICFIPGISLSQKESHCFVQYIYTYEDEHQQQKTITGYVDEPIEAFQHQEKPFLVKVGSNIFTETFISVDLEDQQLSIKGKVGYSSFKPIESSVLQPNIMGFFAYIPKMECYHGVISMNHSLSGSLMANDTRIDFTNGKGYVEKDWGSSFPKDYRWVQCNDFEDKQTSLFFSVAHIPFHIAAFKGFICNLVVNDQEYRFATYNRSKLLKEEQKGNELVFVLENKQARLTIFAKATHTGELIAPKNGTMEKSIKEGLIGEVSFQLLDKQTGVTIQDKGKMAGVEIVDDI